MLLLLFQFILVISVVYGVPALILWLAFDLSLLQIVVFSGIAGTLLIVALSAMDAPAFLQPQRKKKPKRREGKDG